MIIMIYGAPCDPWAARMSSRERQVGRTLGDVSHMGDAEACNIFFSVSSFQHSLCEASPASISHPQSNFHWKNSVDVSTKLIALLEKSGLVRV